MTNSIRAMARPRLLLGIGLAALCATFALLPTTAHATAQGCTGLKGFRLGNVCVLVRGSGLNVERARASFAAPGRPCNTRLRISFFDTNNRMYAQYKQGVKSGCRFSDTYEIKPNKNFRTGRACGSVVISGSAKPGACVSIFRCASGSPVISATRAGANASTHSRSRGQPTVWRSR